MVQHPGLYIVPALERTFIEILSNATDAVSAARVRGVPVSPIEVTMDAAEITVSNTGLPIPVELAVIKDDDDKVIGTDSIYCPQQVFTRFRSGGNYETTTKNSDRAETKEMKELRLKLNSFAGGQNGIGSKLTNVYSHRFTYVIHDAERHLKYTQTCRDHMLVIEPPVIEAYTGTVSGVSITYSLDFSIFKDKDGQPLTNCQVFVNPDGQQAVTGGYGPEYFALFIGHCVNSAYNARVPVTFNGTTFSCSNIKDLAKYYFAEESVKHSIVHLQYPDGVEVIRDENDLVTGAVNPLIMPELEVLVLSTPDAGATISFVNCIVTRKGGEHVDACIHAICDDVVKKLNEETREKIEQKEKKKKDFKPTEKEKNSLKINISHVRPHLSMIVTARVLHPDLEAQTKSKLENMPMKVVLPEGTLKSVNNWSLVHRLRDEIEFKKKVLLNSKSKSAKGTGKHQRANFAGTAKGVEKCALSIVEGDSAKGYWNSLLKWVEGDHDYMGCLPIRGKFINVMKADEEDIVFNEEAKELAINALQLEPNVDYTVPANRAKLPYSHIIIMTDADVDGKHIIGLLLLFFYCRYPSVIAAGMISIYRTAMIRCWLDTPGLTNDDIGEECHTFFTDAEFREWEQTADMSKKWVIKYYKGLGTARDVDIELDAMAPAQAICLWDSRIGDSMELAFSAKQADARKKWLAHYERYISLPDIMMLDLNCYFNPKLAAELEATGGPEVHEQLRAVEALSKLPVSLFLNHEFIEYGKAANLRAIPSASDGLKESVRKIIYTAHEHWKIGSTKLTEYKVAQFAYDVAKKTEYEHGEDNLHEVVMGLAQFFVGANNLPLFRAGGQFGSRVDGGKDHPAPRYAFTDPTKVFSYIFRKEDWPLLVQKISHERTKIEPERYYPLIPLHVVNGTQGIGYAYRSWFPNHNPLDVIEWLLKRLRGLNPGRLTPWYRGFTGKVEITDKKHKEEKPSLLPLLQASGITEMNLTEEDLPDTVVENAISGSEALDEIEAEKAKVVVRFTGRFHIEKNNDIVVTELPIGRYPNPYMQFLKKKKMCTKITDKCVGDKVHIIIHGWHKPQDITLQSLMLVKSMSLSNLVCLNENDDPVVYPTIEAVMEAFYQAALPKYYKRREMEIAAYKSKIAKKEVKKRYAELRAQGVVVLDGKTGKQLKEHLIAHGLNPELADSPTTSSTADKIPEYTEAITKLQQQMKDREAIAPETTYTEELQQLARVVKQELERIDSKSKKGKK